MGMKSNTDVKAKESEDNLDEESPPTEESSDILQKQTFTKQEQDKSEETKEDSEEQSSDIDSEEEQTREEKNGLTEEEKTLGSMKTRAGIISVIVNCKDIKRYGKEAYRTCFKEEFLSFIRNRQKAIRKANALCRKELGKETVTRSLRLCRQEKFSE
jgi:translation initiation factor 2B subunit (eIF-2B alpha/beta/delta family)